MSQSTSRVHQRYHFHSTVDFFTFQRTLRRAWLEDMEKDADAQSAVLRSLLDDYVDGSGDDFALRSLLCPYGQQVMRASS